MPKYVPLFSKVTVTRKCLACGSEKNIERHHLAREKLFVVIHTKTPLSKTRWYKKLVARYAMFNDFDVRHLCNSCHKRIHRHLNGVLKKWNKSREWPPKNIAYYTAVECDELMKVFKEASLRWIEKEAKKKRRKS